MKNDQDRDGPTRIFGALESASAPHRFLDALIARWMGYSREDTPNGIRWRDAHGKAAASPPSYTRYVHDARSILDAIAPGRSVAISCDARGATAIVEGGRKQTAPNPAMALCKIAVCLALEEE